MFSKSRIKTTDSTGGLGVMQPSKCCFSNPIREFLVPSQLMEHSFLHPLVSSGSDYRSVFHRKSSRLTPLKPTHR